MKRIEAGVGQHINVCINKLIENTNIFGICSMEFNGVDIISNKGDTLDMLIKQYQEMQDKKYQTYINSDEYIEKEKEKKKEIAILTIENVNLMNDLENIDFNNSADILEWICKMEGPNNHNEVNIDKYKIISYFEEKGFYPNVNIGDDFIEDDSDNVARYIIGQSLDTLKEYGSINQVAFTFIEKWNKKFNTSKELNVKI